MMKMLCLALCASLLAVFAAACSSGGGGDETAQTATTEEVTKEVAQVALAELANPVQGEDPVCNMKLTDSFVTAEYEGKTYGFCSARCAEAFEAEPMKYLAQADPEEESHEGHDH